MLLWRVVRRTVHQSLASKCLLGFSCNTPDQTCVVPPWQILSDTKELQKEINNLTGKLDRTFAVTDELVFKVKCKPCTSRFKCFSVTRTTFFSLIYQVYYVNNMFIFLISRRTLKKMNPFANPTSTWLHCMKYVIMFDHLTCHFSQKRCFMLTFHLILFCRTAISWSKPSRTPVQFWERSEIWRSR